MKYSLLGTPKTSKTMRFCAEITSNQKSKSSQASQFQENLNYVNLRKTLSTLVRCNPDLAQDNGLVNDDCYYIIP